MRPTRQSLTKQIGIPKRNMENRNETDRNNTRWHNSPRVSYYVDHFSLSAPVLRHGMPCLWLKDCHVAALLAMTQNWNVFIWKTDVFHLCGYFLRGVAPHRHSNVSFRKLFRFSAKPAKFVIARRARAPDAAIFDGTRRHPGTRHDETERDGIPERSTAKPVQ